MKATAVAHPNIALVKYWGKRDEALVLPHQPSLSMTLDGLSATTTVEFCDRADDAGEIDGRALSGKELARVVHTLDLVRARSGVKLRARMVSKTDFPNAAGLASSAAGGAALAAAASWAAGLDTSPRDLSILARRNSGSACRSVEGGFCEWQRGQAEDGSDSYAVQVAPESHWPQLRMVVVVTSSKAKEVSSRDGMRHTVETSPFYAPWVEMVTGDLAEARAALLARDLDRLGAVAECNAWRMHATGMGAVPPVVYIRSATLAVVEELPALRASGTPAWFTLDAGPNPVVLCLDRDAPKIVERLSAIPGVLRAVIAGPGRGVRPSEKHLF
ncbi:MAG TPA: diphosphomevalonate decarboxylase [Myxococcales bacterium]|jgi:diphosphomevalonate decarboxylase